MPKIVDREQRREELVRIVWDVISREGIEGATVRKVAETAGLSVGGLRHYFDSQRGLLRFAAEAIGRSVGERVTGHLRADLPGGERAQRILEEMLPLDENRRVEVEVWLACLVRSHTDEVLAEVRDTAWAGERHLCRLVLASYRDMPLPAGVDREFADAELERQAARLHVFMDGLTLQTATYPQRFTPQSIRAAIRDELRLLTGTPPLPPKT